MSILIKGTNGFEQKSDPSKGYPPGNVTNVTIKGGYKRITISWLDPTDTTVGNVITAWKSTTLVRKKGSIPTSIDDGTVVLINTTRNNYSAGYTDSNLDVATYYYRFFTCSTENVYNNSSDMIYSDNVVEFDSVLKNNSWEQINAASERGVASSLWNIGDEIDITLSGTYSGTYTLQIWDFNHFDKSDGSGKAGICFGMKNLMNAEQYMNSSKTNVGGWNSSYMKTTVMKNSYNSMQSDLKSYIKQVNTYANAGGRSTEASKGALSEDYVFIPGHVELFGSNAVAKQKQTESAQVQFPIFTDKASRVKSMSNGSGSANYYWTRSAQYQYNSNFYMVNEDGSNNFTSASVTEGVCLCFNV